MIVDIKCAHIYELFLIYVIIDLGVILMLKIGLDLDGVVFDSEATFRTYEEIYDIELGQNNLVDRSEPKLKKRYNWTKEQQDKFNEYFLEVSQSSTLMSGFKKVYSLLRKMDIEFIVITARGLDSNGNILQSMEDDAKRILDENGIVFDKYYWKQSDKLDVCLKENIDIMIDDDYKIVDCISKNGIRTLYFRDTNLKKLDENEHVKEVNNWGDVYRIIYNTINKI